MSEKNIEKLDKLPKGWQLLNSHPNTAPAGYCWANNKKSRFEKEYKQALIKII